MTHRVFAGIATALALSASVAAASDYFDFRIPAHSTSRLDLSLTGRYAPSERSSDYFEREMSHGEANVSGSWASGYDSERLQYGLLLLGGARGGVEREEFRFQDLLRHDYQDGSNRFMQELFGLQASIQNYPTAAAWAVGAAIAGDARYSQSWRSVQDSTWRAPVRQRHSNDSESWTYQYVADASAFTGWGRVRDATGVHQVQFIEDRLVNDGVLAEPLQQQTRQRLAELFYLRKKFSVVHDQPDRFFWSEFERILRTDPALREDSFNAYAVMHASDRVVVASRLDRQVGFFFGPMITFRHVNYTQNSSASVFVQEFSNDTLITEISGAYSNHYETDDQRGLGGFQATVEQPLSLRWHLTLFATAQADLRGIHHWAELRSGLSLRYWGGERWYAEARVNQSRTKGQQSSYGYYPNWGVSYGGTASYFLEDHVSIDVGVSQSQSHDYFAFTRNGLATVGLSYRRGALTAPGLVGKVRPVGS